jgi:hypothetical protein
MCGKEYNNGRRKIDTSQKGGLLPDVEDLRPYWQDQEVVHQGASVLGQPHQIPQYELCYLPHLDHEFMIFHLGDAFFFMNEIIKTQPTSQEES